MTGSIKYVARQCNWCNIVALLIGLSFLIYGLATISMRVDALQLSIERLSVLAEKNKRDLLDAISLLERKVDR